jgi:hypothetical protein
MPSSNRLATTRRTEKDSARRRRVRCSKRTPIPVFDPGADNPPDAQKRQDERSSGVIPRGDIQGPFP